MGIDANVGMPVLAGRPMDVENYGGGGRAHAGQAVAVTVRAPAAGEYVFSATVACPGAGAQFHMSLDGVDCTGTIEVPKTADWGDWNTVASRPFRLAAGDHVMRLCIDRNAGECGAAGQFDKLFVTPVRPGVSLAWKPEANAPAARFEGVGRVVHGKLYTFGGYTSVVPFGVTNRASVYDPGTGKWTDMGAIPIPETHCGVAVDEARGRIVFLGGRRGVYPGTATSEVWQYDIAGNAWARLGPLPEPLSAGAAEIVNGQIHYVGGNRGQDRETDYELHYVLGPGETAWHKAAPLPAPRDHVSAVTLGGKLYVFGGEIGHDAHHRQQMSAWAYDPATNAWTTLADMPIGKSHAESSTFVLNGRVVIAGGQVDNWLATGNIVEYDPASNTWAMLPPLPKPLEGVIVQPLGDRLYVTGGYVGTNSIASVGSYSSNYFTGEPNSTTGVSPAVVLYGLALLMIMGGLFALGVGWGRTIKSASKSKSRTAHPQVQPQS